MNSNLYENFSISEKEKSIVFIQANFGRLSERKMAKQLNVSKTTVNRWCQELKLVRIKNKVNDDYFTSWSPKMAYILGFIFADGNINWNPSKSYRALTITASAKDKGHLEAISVELESTKPLVYSQTTNSYRLIVNSKKLCSDLINLGVVPKKSLIVEFPSISGKYLSDFIRGVIDGDGNVRYVKRKRSSYFEITISSGSEKFLAKMAEEISALGINAKPRKVGGNVFILQYSCQRGLDLAKWIYQDASLCLYRKLNQYKEALKSKGVDEKCENTILVQNQ